MNTIEEVATSLGIMLEPSKIEGPGQTLTFLGIQVDTAKGEIRLPKEKLSELLDLLARWQGKKHASKNEMQSLTACL